MIIDKNKFIKSYNKIIGSKKSESSDIIFSYTSEFESEHFERLLDIDNNLFTNLTMWIRKSKKNKYLSLGAIQEYLLKNENKSQLNSRIESLAKNAVSMNYTNQKNIPMFIGGQNFNINNNNTALWKDIPIVKYWIPEVLLMIDEGAITITHFFKIKTNVEKIIDSIEYNHNYLIEKIKLDPKKEDKRIALKSKKILTDKNIFKDKIEIIKSYINDSKVSKVVISNILSYKINKIPSYANLLLKMSIDYPDCAIFYYSFNNKRTFLGASPEKILSKEYNTITIDALAGSASMEDQDFLLNNKKINDEHSFVTDGIVESLQSMDFDCKLSKRSILKLKNIAHLKTIITSKIDSNKNPLNILDAIIPTPALSGYPKESSMEVINNIEEHERGWYAGPIGWINSNMDCKFFAGLRSAYIRNNKIYFYAGAGIVINSNSDEEWDEIINKINSIANIIDG